MSPGISLALAVVGGEMRVGWVDPAAPGFSDWNAPWSRAHVLLPVSSLVADALYQLVALAGRAAPEPIS